MQHGMLPKHLRSKNVSPTAGQALTKDKALRSKKNGRAVGARRPDRFKNPGVVYNLQGIALYKRRYRVEVFLIPLIHLYDWREGRISNPYPAAIRTPHRVDSLKGAH